VKKLALLGSTGSIGVSTLALVREFPEKFHIHGMVAGRNLPLLAKQVREFSPVCVSIQREEDVPRLRALIGRDDRSGNRKQPSLFLELMSLQRGLC